MNKTENDDQLFRGLLHSDDGIITQIFEANDQTITFLASFRLSDRLIERLEHAARFLERLKTPQDPLIFSERSRIARLGIQISCEPPSLGEIIDKTIQLTMVASAVIPGYPTLGDLKDFFTPGFPVGRLIFCEPEALLTSEEVLAALEGGEMKLPASTKISSNGTIYIAPHNVVCYFKEAVAGDILGRILLRKDGRDFLNRYQLRQETAAVIIPPGEGIVTTCSMYLSDHYVVLQCGFELGTQLPATVLDPIKTRGINIYLEIINGSRHPIVNPLIPAKIYRASKFTSEKRKKPQGFPTEPYPYQELRQLEKRLQTAKSATCRFVDRPLAMIRGRTNGLDKAEIFLNGPDRECDVPAFRCAAIKRYAAPASICPHVFATSKLSRILKTNPVALVMRYFPNLVEHRDIINLASDGKIRALYFFEPSSQYGSFLSDRDHNQLEEYYDMGLEVYWVSMLTDCLLISTKRDNKGYFVAPKRLAAFQKSMLFAFYGSNQPLSKLAIERLSLLMDALIGFWGPNIGIVTGGGSGVMEQANKIARKRGILSGANFLEITDQKMTTAVDFCQVFQATCRHSRQKWFEVTSFPIFNVGGLGSMEEFGITLCNMKLAIAEPVPIILFDTEGDGSFWKGAKEQVLEMVRRGRAPKWIENRLVITSEPQVVIEAYRDLLQLF